MLLDLLYAGFSTTSTRVADFPVYTRYNRGYHVPGSCSSCLPALFSGPRTRITCLVSRQIESSSALIRGRYNVWFGRPAVYWPLGTEGIRDLFSGAVLDGEIISA